MKQQRIDRFQFLFAAVAVLYLLVVGRLFALQILQNDFWENEALKARTIARTIPFERGWILARDLTPLAVTENTWDLRFVFGQYRKESTAGQIGMVFYLTSGQRPRSENIYRNPADYVDQILGRLSIEAIAELEDAQKRDDLLFYLERLFNRSAQGRLFDTARDMGKGHLASWPELAAARSEICERVDAERKALDDLERSLGLEPGRLLQRPGERALYADERVKRRIDSDPDGRATFRLERKLHAQYDYYEHTVSQKIPHSVLMKVEINKELYPGFYVVESARRAYPDSVADLCPNLIGTVGKPGAGEKELLDARKEHLQKLNELLLVEDRTNEQICEIEKLRVILREIALNPDEEVGKRGLEYLLEPLLRGKRGYELLEREHNNRSGTVREFAAPLKGQDVVLTLDVNLQRACEEELDHLFARTGFAGAIVLVDPTSGALRALATSPRPSRSRLRRDYNELAADSSRPLLNRSYQGWNLPPPGSVFKLVTAVGALEEGRVAPEDTFLCERRIEVGGRSMKCLGLHGDVNLTEALMQSCNIYFYHLAEENLDRELMLLWAEKFGFGRRTGFLSPEIYGRRFNTSSHWDPAGLLRPQRGVANLMRFCIGQDAIDDVTPLQVARMVAAVATGSLPQPHLISRIGDTLVPTPKPVDLGLSPETLDLVREAMRLVVEDSRGTAGPRSELSRNLVPHEVAGKTGTAQVGRNLPDHAWFAGYLPHGAPALAFAVFVESCGSGGGRTAAPLFQKLIERGEIASYLEEMGR